MIGSVAIGMLIRPWLVRFGNCGCSVMLFLVSLQVLSKCCSFFSVSFDGLHNRMIGEA